MGEENRIPRILSLLEAIWKQRPNLQFNELIFHLQQAYSKSDLGKKMDTRYTEFSKVEDKRWEIFLQTQLKEIAEKDVQLEALSFEKVSNHKECTHYFIEEENESLLTALDLTNHKYYPLYYDSSEKDYYVVNEIGKRCYSIDVAVKVKMVKGNHSF